MSDDTKVPPENREDVEPEQSREEIRHLMDRTRDHYERVYGVRPAILLDATSDNSDWLRDPKWWDPALAEPPESDVPAAEPEDGR